MYKTLCMVYKNPRACPSAPMHQRYIWCSSELLYRKRSLPLIYCTIAADRSEFTQERQKTSNYSTCF
ncbi:hypothetical protein PHYPO_G00071550 [Pangasianodon hypophthalmus]|uniref:Uncharacterized protein n=1 Tax=Pangasianodon hypophthalmus TaxID=310915 RepID=A0A5N5LW90_PANHP|nr:hypothetical protein PHYPO_G00071550 [Pangasianodon hypophthalmus]